MSFTIVMAAFTQHTTIQISTSSVMPLSIFSDGKAVLGSRIRMRFEEGNVYLPPTVTIPANDAPPCGCNVIPVPTVILPLTVSSPVTARVDPSKVKLPLSSSSPPVPAITTRLSV